MSTRQYEEEVTRFLEQHYPYQKDYGLSVIYDGKLTSAEEIEIEYDYKTYDANNLDFKLKEIRFAVKNNLNVHTLLKENYPAHIMFQLNERMTQHLPIPANIQYSDDYDASDESRAISQARAEIQSSYYPQVCSLPIPLISPESSEIERITIDTYLAEYNRLFYQLGGYMMTDADKKELSEDIAEGVFGIPESASSAWSRATSAEEQMEVIDNVCSSNKLGIPYLQYDFTTFKTKESLQEHTAWLKAGATTSEQPKFDEAYGFNFSGMSLQNADFSEAVLVNCSFKNSNLSNADFYGATVQNCDFTGATMDDVLAVKSTFLDCDFSFAKMQGTDFRQASMPNNRFLCTELSETNWLLATIKNGYFELNNCQNAKNYENINVSFSGATENETTSLCNHIKSQFENSAEKLLSDRIRWADNWITNVENGTYSKTKAYENAEPYLQDILSHDIDVQQTMNDNPQFDAKNFDINDFVDKSTCTESSLNPVPDAGFDME